MYAYPKKNSLFRVNRKIGISKTGFYHNSTTLLSLFMNNHDSTHLFNQNIKCYCWTILFFIDKINNSKYLTYARVSVGYVHA